MEQRLRSKTRAALSSRSRNNKGGVGTQSTWGVQGEGNWLEAPKCGDRGAGSANRARGRACGIGQGLLVACVSGTRDPTGTA